MEHDILEMTYEPPALGTLVNAGFPRAIAARLGITSVSGTYLASDLRTTGCLDRILARHSLLVAGDLPRAIEEDPEVPRLRAWLQDGNKLLYYVGWKDYAFLRQSGALFGIELRDDWTTNPLPETIQWARPVPRMVPSPPPLRYLYSGVMLNGAELCAQTARSQLPAIVQKRYGRGLATLVLGPISLPAGGEWFCSTRFAEYLATLMGTSTRRLTRYDERDTTPAMGLYSTAISQLVSGDKRGALDTMLSAIRVIDQSNRSLFGEACLFLRWLGKLVGDPTAVLYAGRQLLSNWTFIEEGYDFQSFQRHRYKHVHAMDQAAYLTLPVLERLTDSEDALKAYFNEAQGHIPEADIEMLRVSSGSIAGMRVVAEVIERDSDVGDIVHAFATASILTATGSSSAFAHPRSHAISIWISLANALMTGPINPDSSTTYRLIELQAATSHRPDQLYDANFRRTNEILAGFLERLIAGSETEAWALLGRIRDPFASSVALAVLRVRQALQLDPLGFLTIFREVEPADRSCLARRLTEIAHLRVEGRPVTCTLVYSNAHKIDAELQTNSLLQFSLLDSDAPRRISGSAGVWPVLICRMDGSLIGGCSLPSNLIDGRQVLISRSESALISVFGEACAIVSIYGIARGIRVTGVANRELRYSSNVWSQAESLNVDQLSSILQIRTSAAMNLVRVLGDIRYIEESGHPAFHGTTIVLRDRLAPPFGEGGVIEPPLETAQLTEDGLARLLSEDGACVFDPEIGLWLQHKVTLHASQDAWRKAEAEHPNVGKRHQSAIAMSLDDPEARILVCSADGGCLAVRSGSISVLW